MGHLYRHAAVLSVKGGVLPESMVLREHVKVYKRRFYRAADESRKFSGGKIIAIKSDNIDKLNLNSTQSQLKLRLRLVSDKPPTHP